jgi:hypothetical protein
MEDWIARKERMRMFSVKHRGHRHLDTLAMTANSCALLTRAVFLKHGYVTESKTAPEMKTRELSAQTSQHRFPHKQRVTIGPSSDAITELALLKCVYAIRNWTVEAAKMRESSAHPVSTQENQFRSATHCNLPVQMVHVFPRHECATLSGTVSMEKTRALSVLLLLRPRASNVDGTSSSVRTVLASQLR